MNKDYEWIYGVWFVGWGDGDWVGMVGRLPDGGWRMDYRFRYYKDDRVDGSKDRKSFWQATCPDDPTQPLAAATVMDTCSILTAKQYSAVVTDFVDLRCANDDPKVGAELAKKPWTHIMQKEAAP